MQPKPEKADLPQRVESGHRCAPFLVWLGSPYDKIKLALLPLLLVGVPVAAQRDNDRLLETARQFAASMIGLSPTGADTYARRVVEFSSPDRLKALTHLDMQIGEELARQKPNRVRLAQLAEAVAREEASLARAERQHTIATAFQLSDRDRRALGRVIVRNHQAELAGQKPAFSPLP